MRPRRVVVRTHANCAHAVVENDRVLIYLRFNSYIPGHVILFKLPVDVVAYLSADETNMKMVRTGSWREVDFFDEVHCVQRL